MDIGYFNNIQRCSCTALDDLDRDGGNLVVMAGYSATLVFVDADCDILVGVVNDGYNFNDVLGD